MMMKRKRLGQDDTAKNAVVGDKNQEGGPSGEIVSYGILLYKRGDKSNSCEKTTATTNDNDNADHNARKQQKQQPQKEEEKDDDEIRFLLGLIPQRNWWTVFKGLPHTNDQTGVVTESPHETALREFQEETSIALKTTTTRPFNPELTLHGHVGSGKNKKKLVIYLLPDDEEGNNTISSSQFDVSKVVKIDSGYMKGKPEIVAIRWLSYREAMNGITVTTDGTGNKQHHAKIYTSQRGILENAYKYLTTTTGSSIT